VDDDPDAAYADPIATAFDEVVDEVGIQRSFVEGGGISMIKEVLDRWDSQFEDRLAILCPC
jgi:hypothetical protein